jgi:hypothetical protein
MAENINFNKIVYKKRNYLKTIDTSFKELGVQTIQEQIDTQPTVQEFFNMYNTLFYQINERGDTNSHEFLIKTSQEYIGFEENNEIIELLQAEIAGLREQLLESQKQLAELAAAIPEAPEITIPEVPEVEIPEVEITVETSTPETPPTPDPPTKEERTVEDFEKYSKSSIRKRSKRLGYSKKYIRSVKKDNNL